MKKTILLILLSILLFSCKKKDQDIYKITVGQNIETDFLSATCDIEIQAPGSGAVEMGTVTSVSPNVTIDNGVITKMEVDIDKPTWDIYSYKLNVENILVKNYFKAYVRRGSDIFYSEERSFTPDACGVQESVIRWDDTYDVHYSNLISLSENSYYVQSLNSTVVFIFDFFSTPQTGIYTLKYNPSSENEVSMSNKYELNGSWSFPSAENEEIFVSVVNGKIEISFCSIPMLEEEYGSVDEVVSGRLIQN